MRFPRRLEERWLFTIEIPDNLIEEIANLPNDWDSEPANTTSRAIGDQWVNKESSVALLVPSVIVPMETNALINPRHSAFRLDWVNPPKRFRYDLRLK
jgi:RES domain-containing protein